MTTDHTPPTFQVRPIDLLARARDIHRETCILARGDVQPSAYRCGMCEVLNAPVVPAAVEPPADRAALRDRIRRVLAQSDGFDPDHLEPHDYQIQAAAVMAVLPPPVSRADEGVTPPPALTEEGRLRAQVEVLEQDAERDQGLARVGARCMREGHQGLIESGRAVIEGHRFALSVALDLGTGAPWEAIHDRVKELRRMADEAQPGTEAHQPRRGDAVEAWLKAQRDEHGPGSLGWPGLDDALDRYRLHADTGTPLGEHVCEGQAVGDCECLEQPVTETAARDCPDDCPCHRVCIGRTRQPATETQQDGAQP